MKQSFLCQLTVNELGGLLSEAEFLCQLTVNELGGLLSEGDFCVTSR